MNDNKENTSLKVCHNHNCNRTFPSADKAIRCCECRATNLAAQRKCHAAGREEAERKKQKVAEGEASPVIHSDAPRGGPEMLDESDAETTGYTVSHSQKTAGQMRLTC
jgi:hypothetical protein